MLATIWSGASVQAAHTLILCLLLGWLGCCVVMTINACRQHNPTALEPIETAPPAVLPTTTFIAALPQEP